jgi:hypothetical protein
LRRTDRRGEQLLHPERRDGHARGNERDHGRQGEHGAEGEERENDERPTSLPAVTVEQRMARGRGVLRPEPERGKFHDVGQDDHDEHGQSEARAGAC